jgi:hypothetical protein
MIAVGQRFENQTISLDGATFRDCTFSNCVFLFSALLPVILEGSSFTNCRWEFVGPAANTMAFIRSLYRRGETELVEAIFADARSTDPHIQHGEGHAH